MLEEKLKSVVAELTELGLEAAKADKGNKAAARRVRVALQKVKKDLQEARTLAFGEKEPASEEA